MAVNFSGTCAAPTRNKRGPGPSSCFCSAFMYPSFPNPRPALAMKACVRQSKALDVQPEPSKSTSLNSSKASCSRKPHLNQHFKSMTAAHFSRLSKGWSVFYSWGFLEACPFATQQGCTQPALTVPTYDLELPPGLVTSESAVSCLKFYYLLKNP